MPTLRRHWKTMTIVALLAGLFTATLTPAEVMPDSEWERRSAVMRTELRMAATTARRVEIVREMADWEHPELVPFMIELAAEFPEMEFQLAVWDTLASLDEPVCLDALAEVVREEPSVAGMAGVCLGRIVRRGEASAAGAMQRLIDLSTDDDRNVLQAVLLGCSRTDDALAVPPVCDILEREQRLRLLAIRALAPIGRHDKATAIPALLSAYDGRRVSDRERAAIITALRGITGYDLGEDIDLWRRWWAAAQDADDPTPQGTGIFVPEPLRIPTYYGIPVTATRIVFVIDTSVSMEDPVTPGMRRRLEEAERVITPGPDGEEDDQDDIPELPWDQIHNKLDLAREEAKRCINQLPEHYSVGLVTYNTWVTPHDPYNLIPATRRNKAQLCGILEDLTPGGFTNVYGALLEAFQYSEESGNRRRQSVFTDGPAMHSTAEAIFFLTDGFPTWSDDCDTNGNHEMDDNEMRPGVSGGRIGAGEHVERDAIVRDIRALLQTIPMTIHCVGIGRHDSTLLGRLARASGGTYRDLGQ